MKITVLVPEHEADVDVSSEDIADAFFDGPMDRVTFSLNRLAGVLRAISDVRIQSLNEVQRRLVREFLTEQAARYVEKPR